MLLFKNGLRKLLKDYVQFGIYLVLITIAVIFTSSFGIVTSNLIRTDNEINRNFEKFDYSFRYTSTSYKSNDTQTFTPWFAFNTNLIKDENNISLPQLTFGQQDSIFQSYKFIDKQEAGCLDSVNGCYKSSIFKFGSKEHLNFHFGDVESNYGFDNTANRKRIIPTPEEAITNYSDEDKIDTVAKGAFGDFYKINFKSQYFKKSLIGQIYEKYDYFQSNSLTSEAKESALNIFDYMFYLNNSWLTYQIKLDLINLYNTGGQQAIDDYLKKGIGNLDKNGKYSFLNHEVENENWNDDTQSFNMIKNNASFLMKEFDTYNLFKTSLDADGYLVANRQITQGDWFSKYMNLLGDLTNFKIRTTSEAVKWDSNGNKYRYISAFYNEQEIGTDKYKVHFYNEDLFYFYKRTNDVDSLTANSFIVSSGYAKYNNMILGNSYKIFNDFQQSLKMDGIGVDSLNVYPTIYEEDLLTNQQNEAIFYINNSLFNQQFNRNSKTIPDEKSYQDVSRTYLTYTNKNKTQMNSDIDKFKTYFADNILNLEQVQENITNNVFNNDLSRAKIQKYDETTLLNMRSSLFSGVVFGFLALAIIFCLVFAISLAFVVYNIFKKVLVSQRTQIGNLKSLGFSNFKIIFNYILYMAFPVIILVPIGWTISLFLQGSLMGVFERYFNISAAFSIDWKLLFVEWISFISIVSLMVFILAYTTVKQSPLKLLSPSRSNKPNIFLLRNLNKIKIKSFTSKLRLVIISSSIKDIFIFFSILLFSSAVITLTSIAPKTMKNMTKEYYKNIKYNNDFNYSGVVENNPLSRYSFYQMDEENKSKSNLEASLFNIWIKDETEHKNLLDASKWKGNAKDFTDNFENILVNNLLTFKSGLISVGVMNNLVKLEKEIVGQNKTVKNNLDDFSCKVLPELFGQAAINDNKANYQDCIKSISNNILPSSVKELWDTNENEFLNFSFNFSSISVDKNLDQMYTTFNSSIQNSAETQVKIYGIDLNSNLNNLVLKNKELIKYDENLNYVPVLINKKDILEGLKVGDEFNIKTSKNLLATLDSNSNLNEIKNSDWTYKNQDLYTMDLNRFTYYLDENKFYYQDSQDNYKPYENMADIELKLKKDLINEELFNKVNQEYKEYSNNENVYKESGDYYIVKPFDIYHYEENIGRIPFLTQTLLNGTNSWFNIALKEGLLANKLIDTTSYQKLKAVGVEELYDGNKIYMDQLYANKLMEVNNNFNARKMFNDGTSINIWSNAKMSSNTQNADQLQRILFTTFNSNNATDGLAKYMNQSIGNTDYIHMKKEAMNNLIMSVISISLIFVSLSLITAIIIIYLITDMFVGKYKRFMSYMRIQGYSMKEINSIIMWIFLPLTIISVLLGITIISLLITNLLPHVLLSIDIAVPIIFSWSIMPVIFIAGMSIFLFGYIIVMLSIKRVRLASLIGNE
ncbi:ABC transporter permease [Spiroplasma floricola]|uniref:ABC transporter permease n=1 Tax=Spiroplasma floricola 23-6 TaxID=1336749 RepID=A0A2K8SGZ9_9MOLU|nr:ABC transporter permease [Spiroplasma floricola]AUB32100.1 ABC transporter permease [Spiroplasma floricola 23-6]